MASEIPADELFESFNGFDEIAVHKAFKLDLAAMEERGFLFLRALVFVNERRGGLNDAEAYKAAMNLTQGDLTDYFPEPEPELDPDDPDTESGKDDSSPA